MFRFCFILAIGLFSCRESSVKKVKIVEVTIDSTNSSIVSSSIIKGHLAGENGKSQPVEELYISQMIC